MSSKLPSIGSPTDSPQLPPEQLGRTSAQVRSWTDDVVIKSSTPITSHPPTPSSVASDTVTSTPQPNPSATTAIGLDSNVTSPADTSPTNAARIGGEPPQHDLESTRSYYGADDQSPDSESASKHLVSFATPESLSSISLNRRGLTEGLRIKISHDDGAAAGDEELMPIASQSIGAKIIPIIPIGGASVSQNVTNLSTSHNNSTTVPSTRRQSEGLKANGPSISEILHNSLLNTSKSLAEKDGKDKVVVRKDTAVVIIPQPDGSVPTTAATVGLHHAHSNSINSLTRLYKPAPVSAPTNVTYSTEGYDSLDSIGSHEAVSLAADLGSTAPRLTKVQLTGLATSSAASADGIIVSRKGKNYAPPATVPGIELCFDNITIETKQGFWFGTRKDMGGTLADYSSIFTFSATSAFGTSQRSDFVITGPDGGNPASPSGGARGWAFLWRSFQKGVAIQNACGLFGTRGLHVVFSPERFIGNTMLRSLAGMHRAGRVTSGVALGNGLPVVTSVFKEHSVYVSTAELCIRDATVLENLTFAVNMRINTAHTELLIYKAAEWTHLSSYLDVKVQHLRPCQVYMLAVAMELVLDPSILFLSYPLDDLNIADQGEVITMLRNLSRRKSIVISLDTMPFSLSEGISQILLLSRDGRMVFSGSPEGLQSFLSKLRREDDCPASRDSSPTSSKKSKRCPLPAAPATEGGGAPVQFGFYGGICNAVDLLRMWEAENLVPQVVAAFTQSSEFKSLKAGIIQHKQKATRGADGGFQRVPRTVPTAPGFVRRNALLLKYMIRTTLLRSDFLYSWLFLILSFVACISLGDSQTSDQGGMQNIRGIVFFFLNCVVHVNVMFVESESLERESYSHLRNNRYFNVFEFFVATIIRLGVPRLIFSLVTGLFAKMVFVAASPMAILSGLTSFTHSLLILLTVYLWPRPQDVVFVQLLYYAYSIVFCGFLINITSVPGIFSALSILRPGYGGILSAALRNQPYSCENFLDQNHNVTVVAYCYTGDQYLKLQGFQDDGVGINALELSLTAVVLMALILACMILL
eukprot:GILI01015709.1.p1 GENE.GILI01015709.1~~GILI01015709.1.p1  ORF type:complete len:1039 (-),score=131.96 GILI01015709.1:103-3219(-)